MISSTVVPIMQIYKHASRMVLGTSNGCTSNGPKIPHRYFWPLTSNGRNSGLSTEMIKFQIPSEVPFEVPFEVLILNGFFQEPLWTSNSRFTDSIWNLADSYQNTKFHINRHRCGICSFGSKNSNSRCHFRTIRGGPIWNLPIWNCP